MNDQRGLSQFDKVIGVDCGGMMHICFQDIVCDIVHDNVACSCIVLCRETSEGLYWMLPFWFYKAQKVSMTCFSSPTFDRHVLILRFFMIILFPTQLG